MPKIKDLNQLHTIDVVDVCEELDIPFKMNTEEAIAFMSAAYHEAAHMVACCACRGASVGGVHVYADKKSIGAGLFDGAALAQDEDHFVTLAGYAMEELLADDGEPPKYADADFRDGHRRGYEWVLDEARAFVREHERLIVHSAHGILLLANKQGSLTDGPELQRLVRCVRGVVAQMPVAAEVGSGDERDELGSG